LVYLIVHSERRRHELFRQDPRETRHEECEGRAGACTEACPRTDDRTEAHRAAANPQKLNWKVSIVDLLKLLDLDSSFAARKELAVELGCPADAMGDSAKMNMWLHKTVLKKLAENGGNIPKELLD